MERQATARTNQIVVAVGSFINNEVVMLHGIDAAAKNLESGPSKSAAEAKKIMTTRKCGQTTDPVRKLECDVQLAHYKERKTNAMVLNTRAALTKKYVSLPMPVGTSEEVVNSVKDQIVGIVYSKLELMQAPFGKDPSWSAQPPSSPAPFSQARAPKLRKVASVFRLGPVYKRECM